MTDETQIIRRRLPRATLAERVKGNGTLITAAGVVGLALAGAVSAKLESCAAQDRAAAASVQASTTQVRQDQSDVELGAAYQKIQARLEAVLSDTKALQDRDAELLERLERVEQTTRPRIKPTEELPPVELEQVKAPLPATPAAAAANNRRTP